MRNTNKFTSSSSSAAAATANAVQKISCGPVCLGLSSLEEVFEEEQIK
jgi:hypothetical protein